MLRLLGYVIKTPRFASTRKYQMESPSEKSQVEESESPLRSQPPSSESCGSEKSESKQKAELTLLDATEEPEPEEPAEPPSRALAIARPALSALWPLLLMASLAVSPLYTQESSERAERKRSA